MSHLQLVDVSLSYGKGAGLSVDCLNLSVEKGELVSLLGPSGCGKTTTMRAIAGLLSPQSGRIFLQGQEITDQPAHQRDIGLVFQSYALFPHLTAFENVAFGLRLRKVAEPQLSDRVKEALASVGLSDLSHRLPANLSGGQQQRVALARAIVLRPRLLLLDEPLSNLDAKLRVEMRAELRRLQRQIGITMIYVTHDQDEALSLSDRIVIMRGGKIEQLGTPPDIYQHPATAFVASFMGYDNLFDDSVKLPFAWPEYASHVAWRPESVPIVSAGSCLVQGRVIARNYLGQHLEYLVDTPLGWVKGHGRADAQSWSEGDTVGVDLRLDQAAVIQDAGTQHKQNAPS
ncbi:MAG: hypothetical protein RL659_508 [Pseudomonadota bacterium]|jgi:putative spermidine/putrescine transport system ATP-binding protein